MTRPRRNRVKRIALEPTGNHKFVNVSIANSLWFSVRRFHANQHIIRTNRVSHSFDFPTLTRLCKFYALASSTEKEMLAVIHECIIPLSLVNTARGAVALSATLSMFWD